MAEEKMFTQAELDKIVADRVAREQKKFEQEKKELERKQNETVEEYEERIANANLTTEEKHKKQLETFQKQLAEREKELTTIKTNEIKRAMLGKYKLSDKFLNRIGGATEEEIENNVKELTEILGEHVKGLAGRTPDNLNGKENTDKDKELEAFEKAFNSF